MGDEDKLYKTYKDEKFSFHKDELLESFKEYIVGVYGFKMEALLKLIGELKSNNIQKEFYITDLIEIFVNNDLSVSTFMPKDNKVVLGFNDKTVLKEMESIAKSNVYNKLKNIISELEAKKNECESTLANVKTKIDQKIEEAKRYKLDVDNAKAKIKTLEEEIKTLEIDLADLNERFGKKDLNAVVEAGNREINAKMIAKQNEITRYREKIGELTEKARAIKDLLINLKKDKEIKSARLENYIKATNYYSKELNRVIDFASENPDTLDGVSSNYEKTDYSSDINLDSPVFDEISKMEDSSDDLYEENKKEESYEPDMQKMDFKALNDSIDSEYASIFGTPLEEDNKEEKAQESAPLDLEEENVFEKKDLSDEKIPDNSLTFEPIKEETAVEVDENVARAIEEAKAKDNTEKTDKA